MAKLVPRNWKLEPVAKRIMRSPQLKLRLDYNLCKALLLTRHLKIIQSL